MRKQYDVGMVIGRFQPFHHGHECVLAQALDLCNTVVVVLGSAQESRIPHNPLTAIERERMIRDCFYDELEVNPYCLMFVHLADREKVGNDASWGEYVMRAVKEQLNLIPDVVFEGYEQERRDWYGSLEINVMQVSRNSIPISATLMRNAILNNHKKFYETWCATGTEHWYDYLREVIEECNIKQEQ